MSSRKYKNLFYPNSDVLINKLNKHTVESLKEAEETVVSGRMFELDDMNHMSQLFGTKFDDKHLLAVHKYLFQDVYEWAGTYKVASLFKGQDILNGHTVPYCPVEMLQINLENIFTDLKNIQWDKLSDKDKVLKFADTYQYLWQCHPFNEGNTRTTSKFMEQYAYVNKIPVNFKKLFKDPTSLRNAFCLYSIGDSKSDEILNDLFLNSMTNSKELDNEKFVLNFKYNNVFTDYGTNQTLFINQLEAELGTQGLSKFATGYSSNEDLTIDDYAFRVQEVKKNIPNFEKIINDISLSSISRTINLNYLIGKEYIKQDVNYINPETLKAESKDKLTQNELLQLNMHVRHKEIDPDVLINKKFDYDNEEYQIKSIDVLDNGKDNVILERTSDGMKFKEEDFASIREFKLHYGKETHNAPIKQKSNEKIKI